MLHWPGAPLGRGGGAKGGPTEPSLPPPNSSQHAPLTGYCANLVQEEIDKYRGENTSAESQRQQALAELQSRLSETEEQAAWYTHKHEAAVKRVDQLKVGLHVVDKSRMSTLMPP